MLTNSPCPLIHQRVTILSASILLFMLGKILLNNTILYLSISGDYDATGKI